MNYLRTLLDEAASTQAPPSEIDVDLAVRNGARIIRRKRMAWVVGAASAVVACLVASALVFTPAAQQEPADPTPHPKAFQADKKYASFGWLPGEVTESEVTTGLDWHQQKLTNGAWEVELRMVAAGRGLAITGDAKSIPVDPAKVDQTVLGPVEQPDGRVMFWNFSRIDTRAQAVRWEYEPGAWVEVAVRNFGDPKQVLMDVVNSIRIGPEEMDLPIHMTGVPSKPTGFHLKQSASRWHVALMFEGDTTVHGESISTAPESTWNTEVDGKKARIEPFSLDVLEPSGARAVVFSKAEDKVEIYRMLRFDR